MDMRVAGGGVGGGGGGCGSRYGISAGRGGGGWGYGCGLYDISMVDRMMLKFRPIAPKPVSSGYCCGESMTVNDDKSGGGKRRYVKVKGNNNKRNYKNINKKIKVSTSPEIVSAGGGDHVVVTLPLMPETPDRKEKSPVNKIASPTTTTTWLSFKNINHLQITSPSSTERHPTVSFVTVERVTKTRVDCGLVDWMEMERDTCPRFISDGGDRVVWTNKAYREMAGGGGEEKVVVVLVRKLEGSWPAEFTCHVKVTWGSSVSSSSSLTVPCDTWILEGGSGGYAWRLDVKAALSLGR